MILRAYRALRYTAITVSPGQLMVLSRYRNLHRRAITKDAKGGLVLPGTDVSVLVKGRHFLLEGLELVNDLRLRCGGVFSVDSDGVVILTIGGVRLRLSCWEELFIAHEVFYRGVYNLRLNQPFSFVDVGMNTGATALYYASNPLCAHVDGFELFAPTARLARKNLSLNPRLAEKISIHEYGLGAEDQSLDLEYFPDLKGSIGTAGLPTYAHAAGAKPKSHNVKAEVRSAGPVIARILRDIGEGFLVCKLDCEGSEYDIVRSLADGGLLRKISVFMIEWHLRGPEKLKELLIANGFVCLSFDEHVETHGMLYAFGDRDFREKNPRACNLVDAESPNA
jgi:FkbM family methyltransferase